MLVDGGTKLLSEERTLFRVESRDSAGTFVADADWRLGIKMGAVVAKVRLVSGIESGAV